MYESMYIPVRIYARRQAKGRILLVDRGEYPVKVNLLVREREESLQSDDETRQPFEFQIRCLWQLFLDFNPNSTSTTTTKCRSITSTLTTQSLFKIPYHCRSVHQRCTDRTYAQNEIITSNTIRYSLMYFRQLIIIAL